MEERDAGGRNTHTQSSGTETLLETGLAKAAEAVAALLAHARAIDPAADEYGHARSRACSDAVSLLKVSAKLGHTVAELRGAKFEHNINVRRVAATEKSSEARNDEEEEDGSGLMWLGSDKLFDWKTRRTYALEKPADSARPAGQSSEPEGDPPPISGGSNGNPGPKGDPPPNSGGSNGSFSGPRVRSV